jgi:hypothetical protein
MAQEAKMMWAWMKEDTLLDSYNTSALDELEDCQVIRCRTLHFMAILEDTSLSNFASETDHGDNVNATAAPEAAKSSEYGRYIFLKKLMRQRCNLASCSFD